MDIVLRENDIKRMIADALGGQIPLEDMEVVQDPLSITISNAEQYLNQPKSNLRRKTSEPPPDNSEDFEDLPSADDSPLLSMEELKRESAGLASAPPVTGSSTSPRPLGANERTQLPPPTEGGREKL